jgi:hypothetical protein
VGDSSTAGLVPSPKKEGQPRQPRTITHPAGAANTLLAALITRNVIALQVYGIMKGNAGDTGRKADIRVSDDLTVAGVPVEYVEAAASNARIHAEVGGLLKEGQRDRWSTARAFGEDWTMPRAVEIQVIEVKGGKATRQQLVAIDARTERALAKEGIPRSWPTMDWLLNLGELLRQPGALGPSRNSISFQTLLKRFDPDAAVTEANAAGVAEELVWTQALGLGDGDYKNLPDTRRLLQAGMLGALGFGVADPTDADLSKRETARKAILQALTEFNNIWEAAK